MQLIYHSPYLAVSLADSVWITHVMNNAGCLAERDEVKLFNKVLGEISRKHMHKKVLLSTIDKEFARFGPRTPDNEIALERDLQGRVLTFRCIDSHVPGVDSPRSGRRVYLVAKNRMDYYFGIAEFVGSDNHPEYHRQDLGWFLTSDYQRGNFWARARADVFPSRK